MYLFSPLPTTEYSGTEKNNTVQNAQWSYNCSAREMQYSVLLLFTSKYSAFEKMASDGFCSYSEDHTKSYLLTTY